MPKEVFYYTDLKVHIVQVHNDFKPFKCDECLFVFKRNSGLNTHKKTHIDSKDFECSVCQKMFKSNYQAKQCLDIHLNGKAIYKGCEA